MSSKNNKNKSKADIKYGAVELPDDIFEPKNIKCRITTFIDQDILTEIKKKAAQDKVGYQTKLNQLLRASLLNLPNIETRLKRIESQLFNDQQASNEF